MEKSTGRRQPSDDLEELQGQLLRELGHLEEGRLDEPELYRAYVQHAQVLAWRGVADGFMAAPGKALECLRAAKHFVSRHMPDLKPAATAAAELYVVSQSLALAAEALEKRRVEDRLSEDRSETERAILQVLAENRGTYLRRGEIHERLDEELRPTPPRVGQILVELNEENVVLRIHGRAQGSPNAAFYALSPRGVELCRSLGLIREEKDEDLPTPVLEALQAACNPSLPWYKQSLARGTLASEGLGPRRFSILKALAAIAESSSDMAVRKLAEEAILQVTNARSALSVGGKGAIDSTVMVSQNPEEEPQPAELALAAY